MSAPLLRAEALGKRYRIGAPPAPAGSRLAALGRWATRPLRRARAVLSGRLAEGSEQELWALRDASFTLSPGEVVGLLGANGAGKTTLLRLVSGITRPTAGRLGIRGRVGSLLEVSIGFHPELTGRENVFLYGALLGLRRAEVRARFDEIVEFSGVARLLDTPMKFYSTGMYTRLAFSVASSLAPDVLLVDEVLSVSDLAFQRRSLGVIAARARAGAGVLFVSHNLSTIEALCSRCLLLEEGRLVEDGPAAPLLASYRARLEAAAAAEGAPPPPETRPGTGAARIRDARWSRDPATDGLTLTVTYDRTAPSDGLTFGLAVLAPEGRTLLGAVEHPLPQARDGGDNALDLVIEAPPLRAGAYPVRLWIHGPDGSLCDEVSQGLPPLTLTDGQTGRHASTHGPLRLTSRVEPRGGEAPQSR